MNIIVNGVNLHPGSKVLMNIPDDMTSDELVSIQDGLKRLFPEVEFVLVQGLEIIGAYDTEPEILQLES